MNSWSVALPQAKMWFSPWKLSPGNENLTDILFVLWHLSHLCLCCEFIGYEICWLWYCCHAVARMLSQKVDTTEEELVLHKEPPQKKRSGCCWTDVVKVLPTVQDRLYITTICHTQTTLQILLIFLSHTHVYTFSFTFSYFIFSTKALTRRLNDWFKGHCKIKNFSCALRNTSCILQKQYVITLHTHVYIIQLVWSFYNQLTVITMESMTWIIDFFFLVLQHSTLYFALYAIILDSVS